MKYYYIVIYFQIIIIIEEFPDPVSPELFLAEDHPMAALKVRFLNKNISSSSSSSSYTNIDKLGRIRFDILKDTFEWSKPI